MVPLFISGPSGVGKSYLTKYLVTHFNFIKIITLTTRPMRAGDKHGETYEFVGQDLFSVLSEENQLVISDFLFGYYYGMRRNAVEKIQGQGKIPVCEVYSPSIHLFADAFPGAVYTMLLPSSIDFLESRMLSRGDSANSIAERLTKVSDEIELFHAHTHKYFTDIYSIPEVSVENIALDLIQKHYKENQS